MKIKVIKKRNLFKLEYSSRLNIKADANTIWELLTNTENFTKWNSTFSSLKSELSLGGTIEQLSPELKPMFNRFVNDLKKAV